MKRQAAVRLLWALALAAAGGAVARSAGMLVPARAKQAADGPVVPEPKIGPASGTLLVAGGGSMQKIWPVFLELAGGPTAPIVVIPTANEAVEGEDRVVHLLREIGATDVVQMHTRDRMVANSEEFVAPLRRARAVWLEGGRQWRLVDAYLNTLTHRELTAVLARGGVIGGTSAGASIQASYLVRGARQNNRIVMARGYEDGFGFLRDTAIDQHVDTRRRQDDLRPVLSRHRQLLGIALDCSRPWPSAR